MKYIFKFNALRKILFIFGHLVSGISCSQRRFHFFIYFQIFNTYRAFIQAYLFGKAFNWGFAKF